MAEAMFYGTRGTPPETALPQLLDRILARGWQVELRGTDRARMEALDLALWTDGDGFRPHGLAGGPHDALQPVLLTWTPAASGRDCLVLIDGAALAEGEAASAQRVCILFDEDDEAARRIARDQWRAAVAAGIPARYFVREDGRWTLRSEHPPPR